jgi:hypothetical protein
MALLIGLFLCGELALYLTLVLSGEPPRFWQHLPLLAGTAAALAFCSVWAVSKHRQMR